MTERYSDKIHEAFEARVNDLALRGDLAEAGRREQRQRSQRLLQEDEFSSDDRPKSRVTNSEILSRNFQDRFIKPPELTTVDGDDDEADDDYDIVYRGAYSESESESDESEEDPEQEDSDVEEEGDEDFVDPEKQLEAILRAENAEGEDEASEALSIQRSRAKRLNDSGFESFFMSSVVGDASSKTSSETQTPLAVTDDVTDEDRSLLMVQSHPEVPTLLSELKSNLTNVTEDLVPILRKTRKIKFLSDVGRTLVEEKFRASQLSSIGILFYLALVASGGDAKNHPVVRRLVESRSRLKRVTDAEERADIPITRLRELFSGSGPVLRMRKKPKKKIPVVRERRVRFDLPQKDGPSERGLLDEEDENVDEEGMNLGDFSSFRDILGELGEHRDEDDLTGKKRPRPDQFDVNPRKRKRAKVSQRIQEDQEFFEASERANPSYEIVKSKGLREKGRGFLHPRIKHRARYYFKTKKLRELNRRFDNEKGGNYAGEEAIEARTVKSRRIRK